MKVRPLDVARDAVGGLASREPRPIFHANLGSGLEAGWLRDIFNERTAFDQAGPLANFNANRYGIFVHWRP